MPPSAGLFQRLIRWLDSPPPVNLVCEIAVDYVAAVRCQRGQVEAWQVKPLPAGAVRPAPLAENIPDPAGLHPVLEETVGRVSNGHRRCALLVPDLLSRTAVLEFDQLPGRRDEAEELVSWRLKKELSLDMRQALFSFCVWPGRAGGFEVLVAVCLRDLLRPYEASLERLGLDPGWVMPSTLAALGCLGAAERPQALVKRDRESLSMAIVHGGAVRVFRSLPAAGDQEAEDDSLGKKVYPAVVYFQDRWGEPVAEIVLTTGERRPGEWTQKLEEETGCTVRELRVSEFDLPPSPLSAAEPDARLIPSLGWTRGMAE